MTASRPQRLFWPGLLLGAATLILYWPATHFEFLALDDDQYIYENPWVAHGLDWRTFQWAWTTTWASNWHPLTWISHLLDSSIYGVLPDGPHFTNILLHSFNAMLLFWFLARLSGAPWLSLAAAALFAWHPLRVESVAWISERKDLLCGCFWLLTLWAWLRYRENFKFQISNFKSYYALSLLFFTLGLLCKPMMVTLPFVLVLLDDWPLQTSPLSLWRSLVNKWPFFALAVASCVITVLAQRAGGAIRSFQQVPLLLRAANVPVAYFAYVRQTFWPAGLCALYPLPEKAPVMAAIGSILLLAAITVLTVRWRRTCPWLCVGWFWFVGTLVPVIGLVQVGAQAWADRYTYIPSVGLFIMLVGSAGHWLERQPSVRPCVLGAAVLGLLGCVAATERQLPYWRNNLALFGRIVSLYPDCPGAQNGLGLALSNAGRHAEAIVHYQECLRLDTNSVHARYNLGIELAETGKLDAAMVQFSDALKLNPRNEQLHNNIGVVLAKQGQTEEALAQFQAAIQINPQYPRPYFNAAKALEKLGRAHEAEADYQKAAQLDPSFRFEKH